MSISITSQGSQGNTTSASNITVTLNNAPSNNDLLLAYCTSSTTAITFSSTGWTAVTALSATVSGQFLYRVADGTEGTSVTYTINSGSHFQVAAVVGLTGALTGTNSGMDPSVPSTSGQSNASSTNLAAAGITTTTNGDMLVWFGAVVDGTGVPPDVTPPTGFSSNVIDVAGSGSSIANVRIAVATMTQSSAGATGTETGTIASASASFGLLVGVSPSGGGGATVVPGNNLTYAIPGEAVPGLVIPGDNFNVPLVYASQNDNNQQGSIMVANNQSVGRTSLW